MKQATRQVVTRSPARTVRLIHLPHLQETAIEAESSYERDFIHTTALFPLTKRIVHQPFKMDLITGSYTPDFLVEFYDNSKLVSEVKPELKIKKYRPIFDQAKEKLATKEIRFLVTSEAALHYTDREERALKIRRYAKSFIPTEKLDTALRLVSKTPFGISIGEIMAEGIEFHSIAHLITRQKLLIGGNLLIDENSTVLGRQFINAEGNHATYFDRWFNTSAG